MKNETTIVLNEGDGALVLRKDGKMQIFLPEDKNSDTIYGSNLILSALYVNLADSKFTDKMIAKAFKKQDREDDKLV
jgi:hypothetical protein